VEVGPTHIVQELHIVQRVAPHTDQVEVELNRTGPGAGSIVVVEEEDTVGPEAESRIGLVVELGSTVVVVVVVAAADSLGEDSPDSASEVDYSLVVGMVSAKEGVVRIPAAGVLL
jgi:hypothetical protein